ncbi:twin-arginine translocase subunit TatC [Actinokineospora auranticolor]|uniref:Sec-independent protein translocase protein TatC n=1 Tax=Actinokineospora auranticolor TaxID=155976 RepID=A0A2S6H0T5_9PSEU|nr:twin-arginine translocase subunit TatC [Actinokineospora auranticolor]PPK71041.1 sec-independent protein translocase protein TatC [Actinokineospora auranticolor]
MSLRDHLYELRNRLGWAALFIMLGSVFGFIWYAVPMGPVPSLGRILLDPYCALPPEVRFSPNGKCQLFQSQPFEAFMVNFKVGVAAGMVLTAPLWLYQVWAFITPGLYAKEKRFASTFVVCASLLFITGGVLAFFVIPQGLSVLVSFGGDTFITALSASSYISFVLVMLLIFGVSFEVPLLIVMLNRVGMLTYELLSKHRRGIIFGLFVFAAFATPGTDPVSMVALAVAMTVLVEFAIQLARVHDKRKARRELADDPSAGLSDDEATPMTFHTEPVERSPLPVDTVVGDSTPERPPADKPEKSGFDDVT